METLTLGVRGNNHLALQLYAELGFAEYSRLPNALEAGGDRFDDVRMYRKLAVPAHLRLRGSAPSAPGCSPPRGCSPPGLLPARPVRHTHPTRMDEDTWRRSTAR